MMKNTLRFALMTIGIALIGFGTYLLLFPDVSLGDKIIRDDSQSYAAIVFGILCLISGIAYKRRGR